MKKVLVLLVASLAFVSAACGGGGKGDSKSSDSGGKDSGKSSTTEAVAKGDPNSDFCDLARKFSKDFNDTSSSADNAAEEVSLFKDLRASIAQLDKKAPDEIKDDLKVVAVAFRKSDGLLKKYDYDF